MTIYRAVWDWAKAANVVREWQAWAPTAPDALFSQLDLEARESGNTHIGSSGQLFGSAAELKALLAPFFAAGAQPATLEIRTLPYLDAMLLWAGCSDALHCRLGDGVARSIFAARSDYVAEALPAAGIGRLLRAVEARAATRARCAVLLDASGGAINRVPPGATAFVHRRMAYSCQYVAGWNAADGAAGGIAARSWLRATYAAMRPFVSGHAYQNYIDPELPRWGLAYYGSNYARLRRIKRRYDPRNVFHFAQSIVPARRPRVR